MVVFLTRLEERWPFLARFLPPFAASEPEPCRSFHVVANRRRKCETLVSAIAVKAAELGTEGDKGNVRAREITVDVNQTVDD